MEQQRSKIVASQISASSDTGEDRYLIFSIGALSFAAPLLSIREIVEPLTYCAVPSIDDYFLGLANLRGQVVGVLDLGRRFALDPVDGSKESVFLIFDADGTSMAGVVNRVDAVATILPDAIDQKCKAVMPIPAAAFGGIAKSGSMLLPVVHLPCLVTKELESAS